MIIKILKTTDQTFGKARQGERLSLVPHTFNTTLTGFKSNVLTLPGNICCGKTVVRIKLSGFAKRMWITFLKNFT